MAVSDQRVQRTGGLVDSNKSYLVGDLHTEADPGEGCVPVGWQLGLLRIKPSPSSCNVVWIFVAPEVRIVMKSFLKTEIRKLISISQTWDDVLVRHAPLCRQSSWPASIHHFRIQSLPCDSKRGSPVNQTSADTHDLSLPCWKRNQLIAKNMCRKPL